MIPLLPAVEAGRPVGSKARVLFTAPITDSNAGERNWGAPHLGVHRLAAFLRHHGHYAEVWDCNIHKDLEGKFKEGWDIIGFSCLQDTLHNDIRAMWAAKGVCPRALLVAGGIEATMNYQDILENSPVRVVVLAEGEVQILGLADGHRPEDLDGVVVKKETPRIDPSQYEDWWGHVDFTELNYRAYWDQMLARHLIDYTEAGGNTVRIVDTSHCNRGCTYCSVTLWHGAAHGKLIRPMMLSAESLHRLVVKVVEQLPDTQTIYFVSDDFCIDRGRVRQFFQHVLDRGPRMRFQIQTFSHYLMRPEFGAGPDVEFLQHLGRAGVRHVTMGVENSCEHCLASFKKPQELTHIPALITECLKVGIRPYLLNILFPPEARIDCLERNCRTLREWMDLGATVSCEPNVMVYNGAPIARSDHLMLYKVRDVGAGRQIRTPLAIISDDPEVRWVQRRFNERYQAFLGDVELRHAFKGATGRYLVQLLGEVLEERAGRKADGLGIDRWLWNGVVYPIKT